MAVRLTRHPRSTSSLAAHNSPASGGGPDVPDPEAHKAFDEDLALALTLSEDISSIQSQFDEFYGLLPPQQTVLVRAYSDDSDDRMLAEIQPRFIVIFEPNQDFIRRIEVS